MAFTASSSGEENHRGQASLNACSTTIVLFGVAITAPISDSQIDDHWTIKKKLHKSDVDGSSRLLLGMKAVEKHVLPHVGDFDKKIGVEIVFYDVDTKTEHRLTLKTWITKSYTLIKGWRKDFVKRRGLRTNDEIGLRWEEQHGRFEFTLLNKAEIVFF
ncbi:B3 domain-containing protein At2g33720-like [Henckelia pumila]|uniref:B3 domain-containing protein At2g33720-like n=1 Tax=Henckelia pumila TaxID=405737 RepID=UPI003C6DBC95